MGLCFGYVSCSMFRDFFPLMLTGVQYQIAKANYEGSQQIGKAGPALGEGLVGWGGQQRKVQQYQVLARA